MYVYRCMYYEVMNLCLTDVRTMVLAAHCSPPWIAPLSFTCVLCSDNTPNLHRSTVEQIARQCLHPRSKVNELATHQTYIDLSQQADISIVNSTTNCYSYYLNALASFNYFIAGSMQSNRDLKFQRSALFFRSIITSH